MEVTCPKCATILEMPDEVEGRHLQCPACEAKFVYKNGITRLMTRVVEAPTSINETARRRMSNTKAKGKTIVVGGRTLIVPDKSSERASYDAMKYGQSYRTGEQEDNSSLCFWLGFLFEVLGLIIAAIIAGANGVRKAISGCLISAIIWVSIYFFFVLFITGC